MCARAHVYVSISLRINDEFVRLVNLYLSLAIRSPIKSVLTLRLLDSPPFHGISFVSLHNGAAVHRCIIADSKSIASSTEETH